ncbi:MAG: diguanylate cyclase [Exilispira sp.]|jgi:diguanylate cyclase (GGDEF)-like protein|nr:diguanylate cyclase [Exilispira sp.]
MNLINLRYEIVRFLGSGNYGLTYLTFDRKLKRHLALKISDINASSRKVVSQLIQQFYTLKSIHNPFIIKPIELEKIYNIDNNPFERDIWFYTMPYISDSKSIDIYIKENIEKPKDILYLLSKLLYAINFLHQFEISHNDIQKQNILVNENGKPTLLDIFPARISKYQYFEDFKQLFDLIRNSVLEIKKEIPQILEDFYYFSLENQFEYNKMKKWLSEKIEGENQHLYFFESERVVSTSLFNLYDYFEKIKEKLSYNNIILWEDEQSISSLKDNFYAFMKVKLQNVLYLNGIEDFYNFLSFKSGQKISNKNDAEIYLKNTLFLEPLYIIFDDYLHFPSQDRKILVDLSRKLKNQVYLIRFEISENESDSQWLFHNIYIDEEKIQSVLSIAFNWYNFDFSKLGFSFSISTLFRFLNFVKANKNFFSRTDDDKILLSNKESDKLKKNFLNYIIESYKINTLSEDEKKACIIFLTYDKPVSFKLLSEIKFVKIRKTVYLNLITKKILRYYKNIDSLGLSEKIIKEILEEKLKEEDKSFYIDFQNYLYENWANTIDDRKNYIKNLKSIKSKKLPNEVILFFKNYPIFTYYANYGEIYDLILNINPNENKEDYCKAFKIYFYYSLATLDLKKLDKLYSKIKKLKSCDTKAKKQKEIYELAISISIAAISYNITEVEEKAKAAEKFLDDSFIILILFYTYSNLLGWISESREIHKFLINNLDKLDNIEYLFYLYGLSALEKNSNQEQSKGLEYYYRLMNIIYNDSKEEENWVFYLKAAHNIAVYYSSLEDEESREKAIQFTKESIYYNEQFKIYPTLLISYSNLIIDYKGKHRNHPEALNYIAKLEKMVNEAFLKNAIEDEQYFFVMVKLISFSIEKWELQNVKKYILKIEKSKISIEKYPLYFEFLAYKGLYLLRTSKIDELYKLLSLMESLLENKLYSEYISLYYSLVFDTFLYLDDHNLLSKIEKKLYTIDKNKIESIIIDHDINYLYSCIIFNRKLKKSLKDLILGEGYELKNKANIKDFYTIYNYFEKKGCIETTNTLNKEIINIVNYSRYTGDLLYSFCDNFVAYILTNEKEYLLEALLSAKSIYSNLNEKGKKNFKSSTLIKRFLSINNSFIYYLSHDKSFSSFVEKSAENISISFDIINRLFDRFKDRVEEDIEQIFSYILKFLIHFGYCTYCAIYKVDESYSIKAVKIAQKNGYSKFSSDYYERCFKIFLTQSSPFVIKSISYDRLKPHVFLAIPILDYFGQITRKESSSVYKFDEYSYFLIFESQLLINPYWGVTGDFATFLENILSFLNNQYLLTQENMYDPLTKVLVRNNFLNKLKNALSKVKSGSLLFIDIDNFKSINDIYSHDFGDKVLSKVAYIIKNSIRKVDIVGRYGGEEFLVFIPQTTPEAALIIAERIRTNIVNENIINNQRITVTVGLSRYPEDSIFSDILISKAEVANRFGKLTGKNKVVLYNNQISVDSISKQYINGLIVRDPIKTSENTKILIELLDLCQIPVKNFIIRLEKGFNLIQKAIQFDYFFVLNKDDFVISNNKEIFIDFAKDISNALPYGTVIINDTIFNYCKASYKDYLFCIGNFKNFPYTQEYNTLFQLYCNTFFLNEIYE